MDITEAALALGMKEREVVDVEQLGDGHLVTTHDAVITHVGADGKLSAYRGHPKGGALPPFAGAETTRAGVQPTQPADPDDPKPDAGPDEMPTDSVPKLLKWAGEDKERAQRALDAERARPEPRATAVAALEKVLAV